MLGPASTYSSDKVLRTNQTRKANHTSVTKPAAAASGVRALRPDAVMIQKPFREADLARGIQRALDAATTS